MPGLVRACPARRAAAARWDGGLRAVAHAEEALAAPLPAPLPAEPRPSPAGSERELPFKPFYQFSPQKIGCVQFITAGINECFLPPLYEAVDLLRIKGRKKKKPTCHTSAAGSRGREDYMQLPRTRCELHGLIKPLKRKHGDRGSREQTRTKRGGAERASVASRGHGSAGSTGARGQGDVGGDVSRGRCRAREGRAPRSHRLCRGRPRGVPDLGRSCSAPGAGTGTVHPARPPGPTYRRVEAQVADVAGDELLLLERGRHAKSVADHRLLHRVHLEGEGRQRAAGCQAATAAPARHRDPPCPAPAALAEEPLHAAHAQRLAERAAAAAELPRLPQRDPPEWGNARCVDACSCPFLNHP